MDTDYYSCGNWQLPSLYVDMTKLSKASNKAKSVIKEAEQKARVLLDAANLLRDASSRLDLVKQFQEHDKKDDVRDERQAGINKSNDEKFVEFKEFLQDIKEQVLLTNGRLRWTEKMIWLAMGGLSILTVLVIPIVVAFIQSGKI